MAEDARPQRVNPPTRISLAWEEIAAAAAMALLGLVTLANVIVRYLTNYSFAFTEEYSIALMVVVALLGTAVAAAGDRHIRITWLVDKLPPHLRKAAEIAGTLALIAMFSIIVWLGGLLVWDEYSYGVTSPALGWPQWIYTAALPVLSLAVALRALGHLVRVVRRPTILPPARSDGIA